MTKERANQHGYLYLTTLGGSEVLIKASKITSIVSEDDCLHIYDGHKKAISVQESASKIFLQLDEICPELR